MMRRHLRPRVEARALAMPPFIAGRVMPCDTCGAAPYAFVCGRCYCAQHAELGFVDRARAMAEGAELPPAVVNAAMDTARELYTRFVDEQWGGYEP